MKGSRTSTWGAPIEGQPSPVKVRMWWTCRHDDNAAGDAKVQDMTDDFVFTAKSAVQVLITAHSHQI